MTTNYSEIIQFILEEKPKEEALLMLFELLKEKIPFEKIVCCKVSRESKVVNMFIEYSLTERIQDFCYKLETLTPIDILKQRYAGDFKNLFVSNQKDKEITFFDQLHFPAQSFINFIFHITEDLNTYMFFSCFSAESNVFSEEHVKLLSLVRPFLEKLLLELYQNNPEPQTFLASKRALPASYEEQLRACPNLENVVREIETIAPYNMTTLITGESGVGKELVATTIHLLSPRKTKPFVEVNCSAIPESLLESELFGFEKGAFTGAIQSKKGFFEQADKGTIFLDEIGEMSLQSQTRLLRVLENKKIQKIGSERSIALDVRVVAATNKNLLELVKTGKFREDLYYRLKGFHIQMPSLRERKKDIRFLTEYFYSHCIEKHQIKNPPYLSYKTIRKLVECEWPGNVRQLKYAIEEAIFKSLSKGKKELEFDFANELLVANSPIKKKPLEEQEILNALKKSHGKIEGRYGAAEILKVNPATLRSRMKVLAIPFKKDKAIS